MIPDLVLVAHGTRSSAGVETIAALAEAVSRHGIAVRTAFVDVLGPSPEEVLRDLDGRAAVVIPAFLASGYHVHTDVARHAAGFDAVEVTRALGPDRVLAAVMRRRLRTAGWRPGDAVVLAAAGSSDSRAIDDVHTAAGLLSDALGAPVSVGYVATGQPRVPEVVARQRELGHRRVFIASYLLAQGLFHQRLGDACADGVAAPIGVDAAVVDLLVRRYRAGLRALTATVG